MESSEYGGVLIMIRMVFYHRACQIIRVDPGHHNLGYLVVMIMLSIYVLWNIFLVFRVKACMLTLLAVLCASASHGLGWPGVFMVTTSGLLSLISNRIQVSDVRFLSDCLSSCSLSADVISQVVISLVMERSVLKMDTTR